MSTESPASSASVQDLIRRLDADTAQGDRTAVCQRVKETLIETIAAGGLELPPAFTQTSPAGYARRLLHAGADYAVVIMVWDQGQGTPIHDHDGKWCVECVYQGRILVTSYDLQGSPEDEEVGFRRESQVAAGRGEAGSLIPPFDYHVIENREAGPAVTIHVYGGEMFGCHVYEATGADRFRRQRRALAYTD